LQIKLNASLHEVKLCVTTRHCNNNNAM